MRRIEPKKAAAPRIGRGAGTWEYPMVVPEVSWSPLHETFTYKSVYGERLMDPDPLIEPMRLPGVSPLA